MLGCEIQRRTVEVQQGKDYAIKKPNDAGTRPRLARSNVAEHVSFLVHQPGSSQSLGALAICIAYACCMYARAAHLIRSVMNRSEWIVEIETSLSDLFPFNIGGLFHMW
jgi:hypothetical protein